MFTVKHNIPKIKDKLKRLKVLTGSGSWQAEIVQMMGRARVDLFKSTPRSVRKKQEAFYMGRKKKSGKGRIKVKIKKKKFRFHIGDGWRLHVIGGGGKDRVPVLTVVYNTFTHDSAGRPKKKAFLGDKEITLMDVLEYGSKAHDIEPVKAKFLSFIAKDGTRVFTKKVSHPGTKAYGMVRIVREKLIREMTKLTARWSKKYGDEWVK